MLGPLLAVAVVLALSGCGGPDDVDSAALTADGALADGVEADGAEADGADRSGSEPGAAGASSPSTTGPVGTTADSAAGSTLSVTAADAGTSGGTSRSGTATTEPIPGSTTGSSTVEETTGTAKETAGETDGSAATTVGPGAGSASQPGTPQQVRIRFESRVDDVTVDQLRAEALAILNDPRGWVRAGFTFVADDAAPYRVVLAEGDVVDGLCLPLKTYGSVSCQNGPVVALNADRWRRAVDHWVLGVEVYRGYLVNHEVGHLIGQRHPKPRCPVPGRPAGVMEQQTAGLEGCRGNPWPRDWELDHARQRPVVYAPLPDWGPDPVPRNGES